MIKIKQHGNFSKITSFLEKAKEGFNVGILDKYGREGVRALSSVTPVDTGLTSDSWYYEIVHEGSSVKLVFSNSNVQYGPRGYPVQIAIILQYGHATGTGGWVEGRDYINPAIQPIFDKLAEEAWKEATQA